MPTVIEKMSEEFASAVIKMMEEERLDSVLELKADDLANNGSITVTARISISCYGFEGESNKDGETR